MMNKWKGIGKTEHERIAEMLSAYIDGELDVAQKARVEAHLRKCQDCARDLHTLRQTVNLLGQLPMVKTPRSFVIREAQVTPRRAGVRWSWAYPALQGATVLAFLLFVVVFAGDVALTHLAPAMSGAPMPAYYNAPAEEAPELSRMASEPEETVVVEKVAAAATPTAMPLPPVPTGTPALAANEGTQDAGLPTAEAMAVMVEQTPAATLTRTAEETTPALTEEPMVAMAERSAATPPPPAEVTPLPTATPATVAQASPESGERGFEEVHEAGGLLPVHLTRIALWVIEGGLLVLAVALLVATLWMRRARRQV
ncbi:MAG: zf-HC2 domain-containing protein [Anaerolineae bacterium]|jgi:anti-sigma factor RsiW|nr:zf-HC2 domain-containing protein [Anaerolineae bacterium]MDH7475405.1 zf-HC2 domain-containing protein [Anaerolineae bacterium]